MATNNLTAMKATKEWKAMEGKSKAGWRAYFAVCDDMYEMSDLLYRQRKQNIELLKKIKDGEEVDITYLKSQFVELYEQANKQCECPVCFELLKKETLNVSSCGHLTCKDCFEKMTDCPICRKTYWKPK